MRFSGLILLVLLAAIAFFAAAPWFAFRSMRDAARTGDVSALARMVDYRALRESLSAQLTGRAPEPPPPDLLSDPVGALKQVLKPRPAPAPEADLYLQPKVLAALADGRPPFAPLPPGAREPVPTIAFWGPDRCRIAVSDPLDPRRRTEFTFHRRGVYSWKLTRIAWTDRAVGRSG